MRKLLLLIVAFVWLSCGGNTTNYHAYTMNQYNNDSVVRDIPIQIDLSFDNKDRAEIIDAINQWNYVLNGWIHLYVTGYVFVDDNELAKNHIGWLFVKELANDKLVVAEDHTLKPGYHALGFVNAIDGNELFLIRERLSDDQVSGVLLHEIGHLLGAEHTTTGLMYADYNREYYQCIDIETVKEVASVQKIPVETMNYCTSG